MTKKRVFSGIRATGRLHLGNYLGAIKGMLELQDSYDCIFSVVDLHTITTPYDPENLQNNIREVVLDYLAAGLDPGKCHLMIQSQVPEHVELAYLLGSIYQLSRLEDLPTYKEKKLQHPDYINLGLLYYPVLMAADILIYKAELVPVGADQEPHLEIAREIARKFNRMFSPVFPEPRRFAAKTEYVPSLLGDGKMSKTVEGSYINLTDDLPAISRRLAGAVTDSGLTGQEVPKTGPVANLFLFLKLFTDGTTVRKFARDYQNKTIRYRELKEILAKAIFQELAPLRERRKYYEKNLREVEKILEEGRNYCQKIARETLKEVKTKMGLNMIKLS